MSQRTRLEDHIKGLFDQYEPEVPEYMWERINKERARRPVFYLFGWNKTASLILIFSIVILSTLGWYGWSSYSNQRKSEIYTSNGMIATKETAEKQTTTSFSQSAVTRNEQPQKNIPSNRMPSASNNVRTMAISSKALSTEKTANDRQRRKEKDYFQQHTNSVGQQQQNVQSMAAKKVIIQTASIDDEHQSVNNDSEIPQEITEKELTVSDEVLVESFILAKGLSEKVTEKTPVKLTIPCPASPNPAWNKAYFEIYGGPDYVSRQFSDTNIIFANMRRESTSFKYAYSFGFRYGRVFNNGLMLKTGLNYSLLTEKFDYIQGNIINIIYVTDASGDTIGSYQSTSARHKITYNKYRTIDVPLLVGYEMAKGRWNFNFSGGLVINLYSWNRGEVLDRSLQPVTINSGEAPNPYQLKTNIGMGLQASAGLYFGLSQNFKLFAEPYMRYNLSSMTQSEISLKQRFHTAGLRMGLRFDFNKK